MPTPEELKAAKLADSKGHKYGSKAWVKVFNAALRKLERKAHVYCTTYCNHGHRLSDGMPVEHECRVIPPAALKAEMEGDYQGAITIMGANRPKWSMGVKAPK